ncbi:aldehyde dehydrogenase family protein [Bradyrhizobium sp. 195]
MSIASASQTQAYKTYLAAETARLLNELGVRRSSYTEGTLAVQTPITGKTIACVKQISVCDAAAEIDRAHAAFRIWRLVPAPKR